MSSCWLSHSAFLFLMLVLTTVEQVLLDTEDCNAVVQELRAHKEHGGLVDLEDADPADGSFPCPSQGNDIQTPSLSLPTCTCIVETLW